MDNILSQVESCFVIYFEQARTMSEIKYEIVTCPTLSLPKSDIGTLNNHQAFTCRVWGGCPKGG